MGNDRGEYFRVWIWPLNEPDIAICILVMLIPSELSRLTERERRIIVLRFGLEDGKFRTLEEVGREFGITRERIRQIEAKALRKLRHPTYSRKRRGYLE